VSASIPLQDFPVDMRAEDQTGEEGALRKGRIHYFCLQATREGQASHAHVHEIIGGLRRNGWEVILFEPSYAADQRAVGIARKLWEFLTLQVKAWFDSRRPAVVYVRDHVGLLPSIICARMKSIPVVIEVNGSFADYTMAYPWMRAIRPLIAGAGRLCMRLSNAVIAVTPQLCDWVQSEIGKKPTFLVPNGANTELFNPSAERSEKLPERYVTFFGAFAPWQGIEIMLRAVREPEWPEDVKLVIVGSGREQPKVEAAAAQNSRIVYLGRKPYRAIPGIIAGGLAGISAKTNPGGWTNYGFYPLKVFETLACGVPAIVTDFPGQRELIKENNCGLVIPPDDPSSLARSVAYLRQHPLEGAEMGRRGRQTIEAKFSWQHAADTTGIIIKQVSGR
jgi:glycosyltransferase involved in cell wall biosynthesis